MTRVPVRDDLSALEGYHSPQVDVRVRLNTNEAPVAPPVAFRKAFAEAVAKIDGHRYPDRGATVLRAAIAELHGVDPAMVFVANGSNEVLQTILLTFSGFGRTVATFEPTYQMHGQIARSTGATVVEGERGADFSLDIAEVRRVITEFRPHVTFLCSPNNPTGGVDSPDLVREVLALNARLLAHHGRVAALVSRVAAGSTLKSEENGAAIRSPSKRVEYLGQDLILTVGMLSLEKKEIL